MRKPKNKWNADLEFVFDNETDHFRESQLNRKWLHELTSAPRGYGARGGATLTRNVAAENGMAANLEFFDNDEFFDNETDHFHETQPKANEPKTSTKLELN